MNLLYDSEVLNMMDSSAEALKKMDLEKEIKKDTMELFTEAVNSFNAGQQFFEPFDTLIWEGKVKVDMCYYDQLLQKLDEANVKSMEDAFSLFFQNIKMIYEFINLKPEVYGKGIGFDILEESNEKVSQKLSQVIFEYLDHNFYSMPVEKREEKYKEASREFAKQLITEGTDPSEAISFSIKTVVMEDFLTKIAFPFSTWSRIQYLVESEEYGEVFDQAKLINLVESFQTKVNAIAKIVTTAI